MLILGLTKTTLLDYPGHVAAALFTGGCNFCCPYCHNGDIAVNHASLTPLEDAALFEFLERRRKVLTGVCITGGEPTLHPDLPALAARIRALGYLVKLDTNGTRPDMLQHLIREGLIDYCAMDIKNAPEKYAVTAGFSRDSAASYMDAVTASVQLLMRQQRIPYEFRTTVVAELHNEADMRAIAKWIAGADAYFLQSYTDSSGVLQPGLHAHSAATLQSFAAICRPYIPNTALRGID